MHQVNNNYTNQVCIYIDYTKINTLTVFGVHPAQQAMCSHHCRVKPIPVKQLHIIGSPVMITLLRKRSIRHVLGEGEGETKAKAEMSRLHERMRED